MRVREKGAEEREKGPRKREERKKENPPLVRSSLSTHFTHKIISSSLHSNKAGSFHHLTCSAYPTDFDHPNDEKGRGKRERGKREKKEGGKPREGLLFFFFPSLDQPFALQSTSLMLQKRQPGSRRVRLTPDW